MSYTVDETNSKIRQRTRDNLFNHYKHTDRMFAVVMTAQWVVAIVISFVVSPLTWNGADSSIHPHLLSAVFFGGALAASTIAMSWAFPGTAPTRHVIAANQLLMSALLIHITDGRTTTHFHIFGSLAFLAFYRDWKVIITATVVTATDHLVRGMLYPQSIFGLPAANLGLVIEHATWVIFEDIVLVYGCVKTFQETRAGAAKEISAEIASEEMSAAKAEAERFSAEAVEQRQYLTENVHRILEEMKRFSEGDLRVKLDKRSDDVIGPLFEGFNQAVANTSELLRTVTDTTVRVADASIDISDSTRELAATAEEQSARGSSISDEAGELKRAVEKSSEFARRTLETANSNGDAARHGQEVVQKTVTKIGTIAETVRMSTDSVEALSRSSDEIGKILKVINDIANQTNLLALNAAIEAARAGVHGESFSVVASQVRSLASDTREATDRIGLIVETIQSDIGTAATAMKRSFREVEEGIELSNQTDEALRRILDESERLIDMLGELGQISSIQASSTESVTSGVTGIADAVTQSAHNVSRIAASTDELNELSANLRGMTSRFLFDSAKSGSPAAKRPTSATVVSRGIN